MRLGSLHSSNYLVFSSGAYIFMYLARAVHFETPSLQNWLWIPVNNAIHFNISIFIDFVTQTNSFLLKFR